ncbi:hypothetical protein Q5P01_004585 [Channa striata]|uniref:Uncharacterized protein n=1 Tax=Channa striata TaxID=64152 RepID=A0AA88T0I0_CHASR|nr:hypothetical protein Q5P01_004585 [Channa striata]
MTRGGGQRFSPDFVVQTLTRRTGAALTTGCRRCLLSQDASGILRGFLSESGGTHLHFYLLKRILSLLFSQQDMKDDEITEREGQKPTADTIGEMTISSARTQEASVIRDVAGNLFSRHQISREHHCRWRHSGSSGER